MNRHDFVVKREKLPYRSCVGVALLDKENRVWIGQRTPRRWDASSKYLWQMPQGGLDKGESPAEAAFRELYEETGIKSAVIEHEIDDWLSYDIPDELLGTALKGRYRGQRQKWFIMRFEGQENEINLSIPDHEPEFQDWRWADINELPDLIIPFKRNVYERVVLELIEFVPTSQKVGAFYSIVSRFSEGFRSLLIYFKRGK